jgi:hypothetical protein
MWEARIKLLYFKVVINLVRGNVEFSETTAWLVLGWFMEDFAMWLAISHMCSAGTMQ